MLPNIGLIQPQGGFVISHIDINNHQNSDVPQKLPDEVKKWFRIQTAELEKANGNLKQEIEKHKQTEQKLHLLLESVPDAMVIADKEGKIVLINTQTVNLFGYSRGDLLGESVEKLMPERFRCNHHEHRRNYILNPEVRPMGKQLKLLGLHKDGNEFHIDVSLNSIETQEGLLTIAAIRDVTERIEGEERLHKALSEIEQLKKRLEQENLYLMKEIKLNYHYDEIIGQSEGIRQVLSQVEQVAGTDSTTLLLGETGTGKELIARAIHNQSSRKNRAMVKVNCAALPPGLIDSELFGREKGAYTGALTKLIGRFELADESTLFLDEISELSLELQGKLLRVLQEGEFERLGSSKTIRVNVRIIAATNSNLAKAVGGGKFREDLYYRLKIFPISIPPLRDRPEDIPLLTWAFVNEFKTIMGKRIDSIHKKSMEALQCYTWPGNIRELRNVIEHAMIVSKGRALEIEVPGIPDSSLHHSQTLKDIERKHIIQVLEKTKWRINGKNGAAEILGLKPSSFRSRMNRLGIRRPDNPNAISS